MVAATPLRFGNELGAMSLREIAVAGGSGSRRRLRHDRRPDRRRQRIVLASIEPNEPILASKITGPGQQATLSAMIGDGMKAVTIRVNDVEGVAGFVLPGDRVDVLLTRQPDKNAAAPTSCCRTCACSRSTSSPTTHRQADRSPRR